MDTDCIDFYKDNAAEVVTELESDNLTRDEMKELYITLQTTLLDAQIGKDEVEIDF